MKRHIALIISLALLFSISACSKDSKSSDSQASPNSNLSDSNGSTDKELTVVELSEMLSAKMAEGDFSETFSCFSSKLKASLPQSQLETAWSDTVISIGSYVGYDKTETETDGGFEIVNCFLKYSDSGLLVKLTYNNNKEIDGVWLNYYTITNSEEPKVSDKFAETAIKVGELSIDGMLTIPNGIENPPIVILVQGSGQSDMNETVGKANNQPFKDIAYGLAENGIASIRYNKRYYQFSEKAKSDMTIFDEVIDDVNAAIELASKNDKLDSKKIYVLGHSLGGMLAPRIAYDNSKVAGVISLAGSPRNIEDIILDQNINAIDASGLSDKEKEEQLLRVNEAVNQIKGLNENDTKVIMNISAKYWHSLSNINQSKCAKELEIPMLFLQGEADFQVFSDKDFKQWEESLTSRKNCSFKLYEGLNHLFMKSKGKADVTEYDTSDNVDSQVIKDIADWIKE